MASTSTEGRDRFRTYPIAPNAFASSTNAWFLMHSEKYDLWLSPTVQFRDRLEAVHERHRDVRHDDFRVQAVVLLQQCATIRNGTDDLEFLVQNTLEPTEQRRIVVGEQNLESATAGPGPIRILKRLPRSGP